VHLTAGGGQAYSRRCDMHAHVDGFPPPVTHPKERLRAWAYRRMARVKGWPAASHPQNPTVPAGPCETAGLRPQEGSRVPHRTDIVDAEGQPPREMAAAAGQGSPVAIPLDPPVGRRATRKPLQTAEADGSGTLRGVGDQQAGLEAGYHLQLLLPQTTPSSYILRTSFGQRLSCKFSERRVFFEKFKFVWEIFKNARRPHNRKPAKCESTRTWRNSRNPNPKRPA